MCLCSVIKAIHNIEAEIFVVDNASTDGSKEYFANRFPGVHFKWSEYNNGFAKANNSVLKETQGDYILFLNPDTFVAEDCLELCLSFASQQKKFGGLGIRMIDGSGTFLKESKRSFPSPAATFFKVFGINSLFPGSRIFSRYYAGHLNQGLNHEIEVLAGAFMMVHKNAIAKTGGFDEDFFMYGEDVDLSYRIRQAGFCNYYFSGSTILHFKGESSQQSPHYIKHFYGAMQLFVSKHSNKNRAVLYTGITCAKAFANAKQILKNKITIPKKNDDPLRTIAILANQQRFNEMLQLLKFSKKPFIIKGRIAIAEKDADPCIGRLMDMEALIKRKMFNHLVVTEGSYSFKDIITLVQKFKKEIVFLFHANESDSIVGSNNKNEKGLFISRQ